MDVVPLMSGWQATVSRNGATGTRRYVVPEARPGAATVPLPQVLDPWSDDLPWLVVQNIRATFLGDCGLLQYEATYGSDPIATEPEPSGDAYILPTNVTVTSEEATASRLPEFFDFKGPVAFQKLAGTNLAVAGCWCWSSDGIVASDVRARKRFPTIGLRVTRHVSVGKLNEFVAEVGRKVGRVNNAALRGLPAGTVLFVGADMDERFDQFGNRSWLAQLEFKVRLITTTDQNGQPKTVGWNHVLDPSTFSFVEAKLADGTLLHKRADMSKLLDGSDVPRGIVPKVLDGEWGD